MATFVSFLLDETGSMHDIKDDTIGGFNQYVDTLKKDVEGKCRFTLVKFDSSHQTAVYEAADINEVAPLTEETYNPGHMTPLIDAIFNIVKRTEKLVAAKKNPDKHNVVIVVQTDGKENRSRENTKEQLKELITGKEKEGWAFTFIGAGIDAFGEAGQYGFKAASTMSYDRGATKAAFRGIAGNTVAYAASGMAASMNFSDEQRSDAGEDKVVAGDVLKTNIGGKSLDIDVDEAAMQKLAKEADKRRKASVVGRS